MQWRAWAVIDDGMGCIEQSRRFSFPTFFFVRKSVMARQYGNLGRELITPTSFHQPVGPRPIASCNNTRGTPHGRQLTVDQAEQEHKLLLKQMYEAGKPK